jgi:ribonuclease BN (tRNA processing enzyme)
VRITVLGKSPSWQDAGGACSGYLVQDGTSCVLLDCGSGVLGKLRAHVDYCAVDAVVISHLHADHFFDLMPYACALVYAPRQQPVPVHTWPGTDNPARPALYAPRGSVQTFRRLCEAAGMFADHIERAFAITEYDAGDVVEIGGLRVRFQAVPHYLPTFAIEMADAGGRFTYGADHSPTDDLDDFARDTDLLLIEATLPRPERTGVRGHLTPSEAGEHAARAGARRLVLTHISDELDPEWAAAEARSTFSGPVEVAVEGAVYEVPAQVTAAAPT